MKRGIDNKGLSPIVASVLMVLLIVVLAILIFLWARGLINEQIQKFGKSIEESCSVVSYEAAVVSRPGFSSYALEVVNRGNVDIYSMSIKLIKGGDSEIKDFKFSVDSGESIVEEAPTLRMSNGEPIDEIMVYPVLIGNAEGKDINRPYTCLDMGQVVNLP